MAPGSPDTNICGATADTVLSYTFGTKLFKKLIGESNMKIKNLFPCLVIAIAVLSTSMPAQAGMVATDQLQKSVIAADFANITGQREWIEEQLLLGGVAQPEASARVAAMTDAEIAQIYQRIDEVPAGGNTFLVLVIVFLVLELTGVIDVIPNK
jgi:hypothetical protein